MKKYILLIIILLFVGCQNKNNESVILQHQIDNLQHQIDTLIFTNNMLSSELYKVKVFVDYPVIEPKG